MSNQIITTDGEIIDGLPEGTSMAIGLTRAEFDTQIATARKYPRSIDRAMKNIMSLVTLDEDTAGECIYALPRGGKPIQGPSVRMAEIVASQWGNCRVASRVVHVDRTEMFVEAEGVFHDLETNAASLARVRRRISDKNGKIYNDDMILVTGNAAASIAKRNAVFGGVPKAVWRKPYEAANQVVSGKNETLVVKREKSIKAFANFGVKPEQVFVALGVGGLDDVKTDHIVLLRGMFSALKNGESTVEEMFVTTASAAAAPPPVRGKEEKPSSEPPSYLSDDLDDPSKRNTDPSSSNAPGAEVKDDAAETPPTNAASSDISEPDMVTAIIKKFNASSTIIDLQADWSELKDDIEALSAEQRSIVEVAYDTREDQLKRRKS